MSKIKLINTKKTDILAVMVPDGATYELNNNRHPTSLSIFLKHEIINQHPLPKGNWQILGISTELTEEQWRKLLSPNIGYYMDYRINLNGVFRTAKESGLSLLEANQCYSVNPYQNPVLGDAASDWPFGLPPDLEDEYLKWQQAQENTGTWLILNNYKK